MGLITSLVTRAQSIDSASDFLRNVLKADTTAGVSVNKRNALSIPAVLSAVRCISETVASLPLDLFRRIEDGGKERADNRPLFNTLKFKPNPEMSSFQFRETIMMWLLLWGNAYAVIERAGNEVILNLWPIAAKRVQTFRKGENGDIFHRIEMPSGGVRILPDRDVLHLKGLSRNGLVGLSPIQEANRALSLAKAMEQHGANTFEQGANPGSLLSHPNTLSDEARENLRNEWTNAYGGVSNAGSVAVLEEGLEWEPVEMSPSDLEMLEERKFQLREIARIFRIQPHLIQDLEDATFSNIETQSLEFVKFTLRPWLVRWEHAIRNQLIAKPSRGKIFAEFNVDGLLRGDAETRSEFYRTGFQNGFLSPNDIRGMENLNPVEDGDQYFVPLNLTPIGNPNPGEQPPSVPSNPSGGESGENSITPKDLEELGYERKGEPVETRTAGQRHRTTENFRSVFSDAAGRVVRRELMEVERRIGEHLPQGDLQAFSEDIRELFFEKISGEDSLEFFFKQQMRPAMFSLVQEILAIHERENQEEVGLDAGQIADELVRRRANKYAGRSVGTLLTKVKEERSEQRDEDLVDAAEEELALREENKQEKMEKEESNNTENFVTFAVFAAIGVSAIIWRTVGENCPICNEMDGKDVSMGDSFVAEGELITEGFRPNEPVFRPPLHKGCDCRLVRQ